MLELRQIADDYQNNVLKTEILNLENEKGEILKQNRIGDHIWYITNLNKFKKDFPNWKQFYNNKKILLELLENID